MVDTQVRTLAGIPKCTFLKRASQMQALLREKGPENMPPKEMQRFVQAHTEGKLVKPEDAGHVIAALSLQAPKSLSGQFVSWDGEECKDFRRS